MLNCFRGNQLLRKKFKFKGTKVSCKINICLRHLEKFARETYQTKLKKTFNLSKLDQNNNNKKKITKQTRETKTEDECYFLTS